jgi:hypothetical protein
MELPPIGVMDLSRETSAETDRASSLVGGFPVAR